jgi:hypothetical protein
MTDKNYQNMLLDGFINHNDFLTNHIKRESIKAKENNTPNDEFFARCYSIIEHWENILDNEINARKRELYQILSINQSEETKHYCTTELNEINRHNFYIQLRIITNGEFSGQLSYTNVLHIKNAIDAAGKDEGSNNNKPRHALIAFVYHSKGIQIDSQNMDKVAELNGWNSKNSGKKIKDHYNSFSADSVKLNEAKNEFTDNEIKKVQIL